MAENDSFKMWYVACYVDCEVGYATSPDGISWNRYSGNPVLTGLLTTWESSIVGVQVVAARGLYHMFYVGATSSTQPIEQIGYASSSDGLNWTTAAANPVFRPAGGSWDSFSVASPTVLWENPSFTLWYSGSPDDASWSLGRATSSDGLSWNRDGSFPLMTANLAWEGSSVRAGSVIYRNNSYELMYIGGVSIGRATSSDGRSWSRSGPDPILTPSGSGGWDGASLGSASVLSIGGKLAMWYSGSSGFSWNVGLATEGRYVSDGQFESEVVDAGSDALVSWRLLEWTVIVPPATVANVAVRSGDAPEPDAWWSAWQGPFNFSPVDLHIEGRYAQVQVTMSAFLGIATPSLQMIRLVGSSVVPISSRVDVTTFALAVGMTLAVAAIGGGLKVALDRVGFRIPWRTAAPPMTPFVQGPLPSIAASPVAGRARLNAARRLGYGFFAIGLIVVAGFVSYLDLQSRRTGVLDSAVIGGAIGGAIFAARAAITGTARSKTRSRR